MHLFELRTAAGRPCCRGNRRADLCAEHQHFAEPRTAEPKPEADWRRHFSALLGIPLDATTPSAAPPLRACDTQPSDPYAPAIAKRRGEPPDREQVAERWKRERTEELARLREQTAALEKEQNR